MSRPCNLEELICIINYLFFFPPMILILFPLFSIQYSSLTRKANTIVTPITTENSFHWGKNGLRVTLRHKLDLILDSKFQMFFFLQMNWGVGVGEAEPKNQPTKQKNTKNPPTKQKTTKTPKPLSLDNSQFLYPDQQATWRLIPLQIF